MRRLIAAVLTVLVMAILVVAGLRRESQGPQPATSAAVATEAVPDPSAGAAETLSRLLDAARNGDVTTYLDAFDDAPRARLEREVREQGRAAFADSLRHAAASRKSHAVYAPEPEGPGAASVVVESVFADHNERQTFRVEHLGGRWRITAVETTRRRMPAERYGTPAYPIAPEAPPVLPPVTTRREP